MNGGVEFAGVAATLGSTVSLLLVAVSQDVSVQFDRWWISGSLPYRWMRCRLRCWLQLRSFTRCCPLALLLIRRRIGSLDAGGSISLSSAE
ncbi:hypothetical protein NPIL_51941 [Nephila pilipes]|uniref:Uncharacterized protein n=1 Tax=Nephila pilipes TaxID=299642 RepID=A0A8X6P9L3_NEPPI|nr:hypothetical protein NPIL_51941 [Nephila pilipes]